MDLEPDTPLLDATRDAIPTEVRQPVSFRITPSTATSGYIFAPQSPISVDVPTTLRLVDGEDGFLAGIERRGGNGPYTVQSVLPQLGDDVAGGLTKNRLRVAGEDYPAEIVATYAQPPDAGILGPDARQILEDIRQQAPPTPYDFAKAVETYLRDDEHFTYDPDVKDELDRCQGVSYVECFAKMKAGARVVNCARGELVDEAALAEALNSGKVAGAGLDVFSPEPPAADNPLLAAAGLVATPHIGGSTDDIMRAVEPSCDITDEDEGRDRAGQTS